MDAGVGVEGPIWIVRAGRQGVYAEDFISGGWVGIGWHMAGPLAEEASDEEIEEAVRRAYPSGKEGAQRAWSGQIKRFFREVKTGDPVATYDPNQRVYVLGTIQSGLEARPEHDLFRARRVTWTHKIARDQLSVCRILSQEAHKEGVRAHFRPLNIVLRDPQHLVQ